MATIIGLPKLSPTMEEGVLLKWTKKAGDKINPGDVIAEVETDKANMDFPLEDEGTLLKLLVAEGDSVKLGAPVAVLGEPGEDAEKALAEAGSSPAPSAAKPEPEPEPEPEPAAKAAAKPKAAPAPVAQPSQRPAPAPAAAPPAAPSPAAGFVRASPVARKIAFERGVDLGSVRGSGPNGRVIKRDIEAAATRPAAAP